MSSQKFVQATNDVQSHRDTEVWASIAAEEQRQEAHLELIASENHTSDEVMAAMGTCLTDKYAEGYPGRRYYGGCENVDVVENLARNRAKELFGSEAANVQPHSGTQANVGTFMALLEAGDRVLAMSLDHGGHLSHGHPKNFSGIFYDFHQYGLNRETERLDMDAIRAQALELQPKLILAGASAYSRTIDFEAFASIAKEVGALLMVDMAHIAGLVAGRVHPSPVPHADVVTFTTHKTLRGPRGGMVLSGKQLMKKINSSTFPGNQGGPFMHSIAAKAIALGQCMEPAFRDYAQRVVTNAGALADTLVGRGLRIVSGGTDNHLMLVDVSSVGITGADAEEALGRIGITCNKNLIPYDEQPPMKASGIRLGTAAITSRGLNQEAVVRMGAVIADVLAAPNDESVAAAAHKVVAELSSGHPIRGAQGAQIGAHA